MLGKVKLIGKAFFSRDPMKEEKDDKKGDGKKDKKKIDKQFAIGKKKFDLSKLQGGLTREEYDDLTNKERGILDRRLRMYASQNPKGSANNIVSTNGVSNKASSVSSSASYEEGSDKEIVVVKTKEMAGSNQPTEEKTVMAIESGSGSDSGSDSTASLYRG